jgi:hypothetical protein
MVILECWRIGAWRALTSGYRVETVEDCVTETQTGFQKRRAEQQIDLGQLRATLAAVHAVTEAQRAVIAIEASDIVLDVGERTLWAHLLSRKDDWIMCGPDKASLRLGVRRGFRERLVALEVLFDDIGYRPKAALGAAHSKKWLAATLSQLVVAEGAGSR